MSHGVVDEETWEELDEICVDGVEELGVLKLGVVVLLDMVVHGVGPDERYSCEKVVEEPIVVGMGEECSCLPV